MTEIDKITRLKITDVWRYEDRKFTPWLCDNIDVLGDVIGMQLTNPVREQRAVTFSVDIKAEDINGNVVLIENQYGASDHAHLGQLITYVSSFQAKAAVWIVERAKPEHVSAINWLNELDSGCHFFLVQLEAIAIGDSNPAPLLTQIVGPSEEAQKLGRAKKEDLEKNDQRRYFWEQVLIKAKEQNLKTFDAISAGKEVFITATAGVSGLSYVFWVNQKSTRIELRIDRKGDGSENLKILNDFKQHKPEIEQVFGEELSWEDLEGYRVCSIRKDFKTGGFISPEEQIAKVVTEIVSAMKRLILATQPFVKMLK